MTRRIFSNVSEATRKSIIEKWDSTKHRDYPSKNSIWTHFQQGSAGARQLTPYNRILIQAPKSIACDAFRMALGIDPEYTHCDHCGPDYDIYEVDNTKGFGFLLETSGEDTLYIVGYDHLKYLLAGIFPGPIRKEDL